MDETPNRLRIEIVPRTIFVVLGVIAGIWLLGQLATVFSVVIIALVLVGAFKRDQGCEVAILRVVAFLRLSRPRPRAVRGIADGTGRAQATNQENS